MLRRHSAIWSLVALAPGAVGAQAGRRPLTMLALTCLLVGSTGPSTAAPITVEFAGVVEDVRDDFALLPPILPGDSFVGFYTYDDSLAGTDCTAFSCHYDSSAHADSGISFRINGNSFEFYNASEPVQPLTIVVIDRESDTYQVGWARAGELGGSTLDSILIDLRGELFNGTDLIVPDLAGASTRNFFGYGARVDPPDFQLVINPDTGLPELVDLGSGASSFSGTLTALTLVPEPAAAGLLALSLLGILWGRAAIPKSGISQAISPSEPSDTNKSRITCFRKAL